MTDLPDLSWLEEIAANLAAPKGAGFKAPEPDPKDPNAVREGWRAWQVSGEKPRPGERPKLFSVASPAHAYFWKPMIESTAHCSRHPSCDTPGRQGIPGESCSCGFYSAKSRDHLQSMSYHTYDGERDGHYCVIGRVANWGKVIEGSLGWRAEKSYPIELFVPFEIWEIAKPLSETYGVPVRLNNILKKPKKGVHY